MENINRCICNKRKKLAIMECKADKISFECMAIKRFEGPEQWGVKTAKKQKLDQKQGAR